MLKHKSWSALLCLCLAGPALADNVTTNITQHGDRGTPQWSISRKVDRIDFTVQIPGFITREANGEIQLDIDGRCYKGKIPPPRIPSIARIIRNVPSTAYSSTFTVDDVRIYSNIMVSTESPDRSNTETDHPDTEWKPRNIVDTTDAMMGTQQLLRIECHPLQMQRDDGTVRFIKTIKGTITFEP